LANTFGGSVARRARRAKKASVTTAAELAAVDAMVDNYLAEQVVDPIKERREQQRLAYRERMTYLKLEYGHLTGWERIEAVQDGRLFYG
jgi:hypothetical protein